MDWMAKVKPKAAARDKHEHKKERQTEKSEPCWRELHQNVTRGGRSLAKCHRRYLAFSPSQYLCYCFGLGRMCLHVFYKQCDDSSRCKLTIIKTSWLAFPVLER